jgi:hypothetical protein
MVQGELFREENSTSGLSGFAETRKSFLSRHQVALTLDKALVVSIAFVIMFALTYSFGVERGKRAVEKNFESLLPDHVDTVSFNLGAKKKPDRATKKDETVILVNQSPTPVSEDISIESRIPQTAQALSDDLMQTVQEVKRTPDVAFPTVDLTRKGSYTIQLVTYADEKLAVREIDHLKTKGLAAFVIPSGRYYQVCAHYFEDKTTAKSFLKQFSDISRYPGAYIRPVIR